jgi:glycosyltransferase involved in cell wall biosynthesis
MSVGRCRPEKNLTQFVKAALYDSKNQYVLVGDGEQLEQLKELSQGKVIFAGGVNNNDVPYWMCAADILANTSFTEGFPVALLEGLASGLPIVAPRVCGIPEIIEHGKNGLLSEPNDYKSTAECVSHILENECLARSMSKFNLEKARQYTWENVVKRLYECVG